MWILKFFKLSLISCFLVLFACSKTPMERLERQVRDFIEGKIQDISVIEEGILRASSKTQISRDFSRDARAVVTISHNSARFLYPFQGNIYFNKTFPVLYAANKSQFVISDGITVEWYSESGLLLGRENLGDEKLQILAIALVNNNIMFFRDMHLWEYNIETGTTTRLSTRKLESPYARMFDVAFIQDGEDLGILVGCAGFYYFSVYDCIERKMLITNVRTASSKVSLLNRKAKYLRAVNTGWQLTEMNVTTKVRSAFQVIREIEDIEIFDDIAFVERKNELYIYDFFGNKKKIPFSFQLSGGIGQNVFILHSGRVFICDPIKFRDAINLVLSMLPELAEESKSSK